MANTSPQLRIGKLSEFLPQQRDANKHTPRGMQLLESAMAQDGYVAPMTATEDGEIIDGSARLETAAIAFPDEAIIVEHDGQRPIIMRRTDIPSAADDRAKRISLAANRIAEVNLDVDPELLRALSEELDLTALWSEEELHNLFSLLEHEQDTNPVDIEVVHRTLAERFIIPPFSVLDARQGYWQERKRAWLSLGIQSELGRGGAPGGSPRPAAQLTDNGHTVRGDGYGRAL